MAEVTPRPQPASIPLWPWLVAPAVMLLIIVSFSAASLLLVNRGDKAPSPEPEPKAVAESPAPPTPADDSAKDSVPDRPRDVPAVKQPGTPPGERVEKVAPLFPTRRAQPAPDLELAARATDSSTKGIMPLPSLSESLLVATTGDAKREVQRATPERERLYEAVVDRFILYDIGRLPGLPGRKAKLDFDSLDLDAIPALVRGLNRSATLDASCPVMAISSKLGQLLGRCKDVELLAEARDNIGRGVGITPYASYLTSLKQSCAERVKRSQDSLRPNVPKYVAALKSKDAAARRKAANSLGLAGPEAKAAVPDLITALKDPDEQVRVTAARALAAIGPAAVPALLKAAESDSDRGVRTLAFLALGESRPVSGDALRALVAALSDPDKDLRPAAALALAGVGDRAVPPLRDALKAKNAGAATALGLIGAPAANPAAPDLVAVLGDDDKELRIAAHHALVRIGAPAVPALAADLPGADLRRWYSISVALGKIGPDAKGAVPALTAGLKHDDKGVRVLAVQALAKIEPGNESLKPLLGEAVPALAEVLRQQDGGLRAWAAQSLGSIGPDARGAEPALTAALADSDGAVRAAAADALGRIGPREAAAFTGLVAAQCDAGEAVRAAARGSLTRLGKAAVPALVDSLKDPSAEVRAASAESLGRIGADAVPDLMPATRAADERVRRGAVTALAKAGPAARPAVPWLVRALEDQDREVRLGSARALGVVKPDKPAAAEALLKRIHDPDEGFCAACRDALVAIGRGSAGPLAGALKGGDGATRRTAAELLRKIGSEAGEAVPALCAAARDADVQVRVAALTALRDVVTVPGEGRLAAAGESALEALAGGLRDADGEVRIAAHLGMIRLGSRSAPALGAALGEKEPVVRRLAAETLGKLGPEARPAAPDLVAALRDADAEVRDGAAFALEALDPELGAAVRALRQALAAPMKVAVADPSPKEPCYQTVAELVAGAAGTGDTGRAALRELSLRRGEQTLLALGLAAVSEDAEARALGRAMLLKCLEKRPDDKAEEEAARRLKLARGLLEDGKREAAHDDIRKVIKTHPRTRAAEDARRLLVENGK
jgi:HEAT repeat protein